MSMTAIETVARTAWGEARGCGRAGMQHVVSVIMNRAHHPSWWGRDPVSVCTQPYQFSCWDEDDPNRAKLLAVDESDPDYRQALDLAKLAIAGQLPDETRGADSYYAWRTAAPFWVDKAILTFRDGWHYFFRTDLNLATGSVPNVPNVSVHSRPTAPSAQETTDDLNAQELKEQST